MWEQLIKPLKEYIIEEDSGDGKLQVRNNLLSGKLDLFAKLRTTGMIQRKKAYDVPEKKTTTT